MPNRQTTKISVVFLILGMAFGNWSIGGGQPAQGSYLHNDVTNNLSGNGTGVVSGFF